MGKEKKADTQSERHLLALVQRGDQEALGQLYQRYYRILFSYSFKISGDRELSRDCIHDIFLDIWKDREKLSNIKRMRPYLLQSVWNNTIKMLKRNGKQVPWDPEKPYRTEVVFSVEQLAVQHQIGKERQDALQTALDALPARQKQILFMIYYEGLSIDEVSEITSLHYQSIKNTTHRALTSLRKILRTIVIFTASFSTWYLS
ncbi:MAG: RNA polymerase sigma factor [Cytophagales bacterium]|nr:RNA polymerase sigma factor [Cytophagales bacterium]